MSRAKRSRLEHEAVSVLEALDCVVGKLDGADAGASDSVHYLFAGQGGHNVALAITSCAREATLEFGTVEKLHRMAIEMGGRPVVAVRESNPMSLTFADLGELPRDRDNGVVVTAQSDGFDGAAFATVRYATTTAGVVIEAGRTEFLKGVMA